MISHFFTRPDCRQNTFGQHLQRQIVKDFFIKFTKRPQKKCQKQILAPDTFADGLFAPA